MKEAELSTKFVNYFSNYFNIEKEVHPVGSKLRVDLVLTSKINKDFVFGIELKNDIHKQGNGIEAWLRQAENYSKFEYNIRGYNRKIPILIYPALSSLFIQIDHSYEHKIIDGNEYYKSFHNKLHEHSNVNSWTSMLGIGEVRRINNGWKEGYAFIFKNKLLWFEPTGHHTVNYKHYFKTH